MRLDTKAKREAVQSINIEIDTKRGYNLEIFEGLKIVTSAPEDNTIILKVYRDTVSEAVIYKRYSTIEARTKAIKNAKASYKRNQDRKEAAKKEGKELTEAARAAKAIKTELNAAFLGIKFSVRSDNFSMGDSVDISWENGPTEAEVKKITSKFQEGSFNGMEDIYEYSNRRTDIPQAKYVQTSRNESEELKQIKKDFETMIEAQNPEEYRYNRNLFYQIFRKTSIHPEAINLRIDRNETTCGLHEDFYTITYDLPEQATKQTTSAANFEAVEVPEGEIQIIEYSAKAIAVIGDTKRIKEDLKRLGGRFNFRLSCGAGWIFKKTDLDQVVKFLSRTPEQAKNEIQEEVKKTVQMLADTDMVIYGEVTEGTREAAEVQEVEILEAEVITKPAYIPGEREQRAINLIDIAEIDEGIKQHETLESIEQAAAAGEQISLFNLSQLL